LIDLPSWLVERISNFSFQVSPAENLFSNKLNKKISNLISPLNNLFSNWLVEETSKRLKNPLVILTMITIMVSVFLSIVQMGIGVNYFDVFTDLNVALNYAGVTSGDVNILHRPPLIPFLTSLVFRAGFISSNVIIALDAIIFVFGVVGLYLLFKQRFNEIQSFAGCLIFISLPLVFSWAASGSTDVPAISFSIWAMYFMVIGLEKDAKYLYLVFPMLLLAILTRYTAALLILPLLLYLIIGTDFLKNIKTHLNHVLIALGVLTPFIIYGYLKISYISYFILLLKNSLFTGASFGLGDAAYNQDNLYYLHNLLNYIGVGPVKGAYSQILSPSQGIPSILSYITILLVLYGLGIYIYTIIKNKAEQTDEFNNWKVIPGILLAFLLISSVVSFFYASYIVTDVIIFITCLLIYKIFKDGEIGNLKIDLLFLSWFFTFLVMHSVIPLKVDRYFITAAPALAYFIILGLSILLEKYKYKIKNQNLKTWGLYAIIGLIFLTSSSVTFIGHAPNNCLINYVEPTTQWLEKYDPDYQDKVIFSDYSPAVSWSIKKSVFSGVIKDYKNSDEFSSMLIDSNAEYYIDVFSKKKPTIKGYCVIKKTDLITIYQKI